MEWRLEDYCITSKRSLLLDCRLMLLNKKRKFAFGKMNLSQVRNNHVYAASRHVLIAPSFYGVDMGCCRCVSKKFCMKNSSMKMDFRA